ncbi:MAG: twin-arginine translocation signal domain-containing protein, partial [Planctomycetota bacterium]
MARVTRRGFLQTSTAAGASLLLTGTKASGKILGANDRLRIAVVGLNGRGQSHLAGWMDQRNVEIAYIVDPDKNVLAKAMTGLQSRLSENFKAKGIADVREALEDKNLDAISIAT